MSLINDALKKAQRQRTGDNPSSPLSTPPMPGGSPAPLRSPQKKDHGPTLLLVGGGITIGLVLGVGAFWFLRSPSEKSATPTPPPAVAAATQPSESPAPAPRTPPVTATNQPVDPAVALQPSRATEPAATAVTAPAASPLTTASPAPVVATNAPPEVEASKVVAAPAVASAPTAKPTAPGEPSEQMIKAIEGFRIMGIRAAGGADAKVLMNDRVYRIGDLVDRALGIRLTAATANSLTFQDAGGATYTRNF